LFTGACRALEAPFVTIENKTIGANPTTTERFLRLSEVRNRIPFSRSTIYRLIAESKFPRSYNLGEHARAWRESEINEWIQSRLGNSALEG
jgi:prophage regulatory protein